MKEMRRLRVFVVLSGAPGSRRMLTAALAPLARQPRGDGRRRKASSAVDLILKATKPPCASRLVKLWFVSRSCASAA